MEIKNTKQQQLTFDKGLTNVPSDAVCSDNTLAESIGMVYDNGEHRVIQQPVLHVNTTYKILFIHRLPYQDNYILSVNGTLRWATKTGTSLNSATAPKNQGTSSDVNITVTDNTQIQAIGKTLIVTTDEGLKYLVFDGSNYKTYGKLPEPDVRFYFTQVNPANVANINDTNPDREKLNDGLALIVSEYIENIDKDDGIISESDGKYNVPIGKEEEYDNLVRGLYAKAEKAVADNKRFTRPFFLRYALQLFDGSYHYISQPILMMPSVHVNYHASVAGSRIYLSVTHAQIEIESKTEYTELSDIVKSIAIFASQQIPQVSSHGKCIMSSNTEERPYVDWIDRGYGYNGYSKSIIQIPLRDEKDVVNDIKSTSIFYKIAEIGIEKIAAPTLANGTQLSQFMTEDALANLTTMEQLTHDDYYSHCPMMANLLYAYNSRINLAGIKRGFFNGFDFFDGHGSYLAYSSSAKNYDIYVRIKTDSGNRVVKTTASIIHNLAIWFFYPDTRADWVTIVEKDTSKTIIDAALTEHPGLNGSYYFRGLPDNDTQPSTTSRTLSDTNLNNTPEYIYNQIATSEADNPFIFLAEGYTTVGNGIITGMSTQTQALSQGQFGQYPLLVFTDEGIWALSVGTTGYFTAVHPMSREVCNNQQSITQTDGAVFFTSKKGLMVISGSIVKCVSEQMAGRTDDFTAEHFTRADLGNFSEFLSKCFIAYDYRDSLLWIFNEGATCCYVYAIKSGTFGKCALPEPVRNVVNYYPDYLMQSTAGKAYSLMQRPDINADATTYTAKMLTRPMKLENGFALKTIHEIVHTHQMQGTFVIRLYVSNTLKAWAEIHSLSGTPFKYYRIQYDFKNLLATDRFSGSVLVTEEKRTNKLR